MSGVRMLLFVERVMENHSNPPILYYGFNHRDNGLSWPDQGIAIIAMLNPLVQPKCYSGV